MGTLMDIFKPFATIEPSDPTVGKPLTIDLQHSFGGIVFLAIAKAIL